MTHHQLGPLVLTRNRLQDRLAEESIVMVDEADGSAKTILALEAGEFHVGAIP
jgi:hypothetical protein